MAIATASVGHRYRQRWQSLPQALVIATASVGRLVPEFVEGYERSESKVFRLRLSTFGAKNLFPLAPGFQPPTAFSFDLQQQRKLLHSFVFAYIIYIYTLPVMAKRIFFCIFAREILK